MDNSTPYTVARLRSMGLLILTALGVLTTLASGGGGGGGGGGTGNTPGTLQLPGITLDAFEGAVANIRVTRSGGSAGVVTVDYATADGSAVAGSDYTATSGTLTWPDGVSGNRTISIAITDDAVAEALESFTLTLSNVSGATVANSSVTVNVVDNDAATLAAYGPITDLNSVTVNGIRYDTNATGVMVNGLPGGVSDLQMGQIVALLGEANFSDATGRADAIFHSATIIGPVENVDATLAQLIVMGQTVLTTADTAFGPGIDPLTLAGLTVGAVAQISGFHNASGDIVATRVELDTASTRVQLIGSVAGVDLANMLFSVNRLTLDYGSATVIDLPDGMPTEGLQLIARGSLADGILVVDEMASLVNLAAAPGDRVHLSGIVTRFASPSDFDLNGFPVTTDLSTGFAGGVIGDLQGDAEVTIDAQVISGSDTVLASTVYFGPLVSPRTTLPFDFENFTNLSVHGLSRVTVRQGQSYSVEVTANTDIINDIQVTQNGNTVTIGSNSTQMLHAVVTMPVLSQIDVAANSLANVALEGFNQTQMSVNVAGVSLLRGEGLVITSLTAAVSGVSLLDLGNVQGFATANVDISGVSQAILNMAAGSSLAGSVTTGQGTGTSKLYYFGTNVMENVTIDSQSSVIRLGDTRP